MPLRSLLGKAATKSPAFDGHALRKVGCAGITLISVTSSNALDAGEYRIAHFIGNSIAVAREAFQQESVWDYPRPPRLESTGCHLRVVHAGMVVAETRRGKRILETSHPPVYYFPPEDVAMQRLHPSGRRGTFCEFKGGAVYWDLALTGADRGMIGGMLVLSDVAWSYAVPTKAYAALKVIWRSTQTGSMNVGWMMSECCHSPATSMGVGLSRIGGPFKGAPERNGGSALVVWEPRDNHLRTDALTHTICKFHLLFCGYSRRLRRYDNGESLMLAKEDEILLVDD